MVDCARRELREETEFNAIDLHFLLSYDGTDDNGTAFRVAYFWCWYDENQPVTCHEGQALAFVRRSEVHRYPMPDYLLEVLDSAMGKAGLSPPK